MSQWAVNLCVTRQRSPPLFSLNAPPVIYEDVRAPDGRTGERAEYRVGIPSAGAGFPAAAHLLLSGRVIYWAQQHNATLEESSGFLLLLILLPCFISLSFRFGGRASE